MKLQSSPKIFENYKSDIPENTIKNIEEGFDRLGLKLEYIPGKSITGLDVFNGRCVIKNTPIQSFGKGVTSVLAKASAYAEITERVSSGSLFYHLINLTKRKDLSYNIKLKEEVFNKYINYKFLDGYSYEKITEKVRNVIPEEFVPLNPLQQEYKDILLKSNIAKYNWVNGYSLSRNEKVRIPIKFISAISGTNGQAAGNTFEEAVTHGLCEVFERYCYSYVMYNRNPVPTIDLNTIKNPKIRQQISFYNKHNIEVKIKDFSLGRRFPVVGVLLIDHNIKDDPNLLKKDMFLYQVNAASALNLEDAVMRCFTERRQLFYGDNDLFLDLRVNTIWKHWVLNMKKRYKGASSQHNNDFKSYLTNRDVSFLMDKKSDIISFDDFKNDFPCHSDFYNDIVYLLDVCCKENKELIVINTHHPKLKFPSVRVIVPEMMWIEEGLKNENSFFLIYSLEDSWFEDINTIKSFIKKAEDYLSGNLYYPEIKTIFGTNLSLFRILAIANLKVRNYEEALEYFLAAKELENSRKFDGIIERLKTHDKSLMEEASSMKNPFVYGWDFKEKAINEFIIPREFNRIISCF